MGMLMMSPGLAPSSTASPRSRARAASATPRCCCRGLIGLALIAAFVVYSFKPKHPLLDLRLFKNRNLTVSILTMFIFAAAFFGGLLLVPQFLQQVQGESPLNAGWLVAPQGVGAMLTMPIAGALTDKFPVGRIVPFGLVLIIGGMFALTQIQADSSHWGFLIPVLFVMGLGMGAHDDADHHLGAEDADPPRGGPRVDAAQHHPADRQLGRCRALLGGADQRAQGQPAGQPAAGRGRDAAAAPSRTPTGGPRSW